MPSNAGWSQVDSFKQNPFKHDPNNKANENLYFKTRKPFLFAEKLGTKKLLSTNRKI